MQVRKVVEQDLGAGVEGVWELEMSADHGAGIVGGALLAAWRGREGMVDKGCSCVEEGFAGRLNTLEGGRRGVDG